MTSLSWLQLFLPEVAENNKTLSTSAVSLAVNIYEETWTFVFIKSIYSWSNKFELVHKIVLGAEQEAYLLLYTNWKEVFVKLSFENSTAIRRINILCVVSVERNFIVLFEYNFKSVHAKFLICKSKAM